MKINPDNQKSIPILFSDPMVKAIWAGTKTQTRRIKFSGKAGDLLWVRQAWGISEATGKYIYRADPCWTEIHMGHFQQHPKWRPSIFMPREASRITLKVLSVRKERLTQIIHWDALAEGFESVDNFRTLWDHLNEKRGYGWNTDPIVKVVTFKRINPV
jgi:hypothetical protein